MKTSEIIDGLQWILDSHAAACGPAGDVREFIEPAIKLLQTLATLTAERDDLKEWKVLHTDLAAATEERLTAELAAYKRAKQENDERIGELERFMLERDTASDEALMLALVEHREFRARIATLEAKLEKLRTENVNLLAALAANEPK
jgi:post-segregation antitoxin (ccd killing protein)